MRNKLGLKRLITYFVLLALIGSIIYAAINIATHAPDAVVNGTDRKSRGDYVLMIIQCTLAIVVMFLPSIISRRFKVEIPDNFYLAFVIFLFCGVYLGEVTSFYYRIPHWDTILHLFSGGMLGSLGFFIVNLLNDDKAVSLHMSPRFVALFAFCFAVAAGTVWEIYEFMVDSIWGLNMQKFALENGTALTGRAALWDTMKDLLVDVAGAFAVTAEAYISKKSRLLLGKAKRPGPPPNLPL